MKSLLIATHNPGKRAEIHALLVDSPLAQAELLIPADLGITMDVEENGSTYAENAGLKAAAFCEISGLITLADDSGLEVQALAGQPGLHSARYWPANAGAVLPGVVPPITDANRRTLLLANLQALPQPWLARFMCTIAIAVPGMPVAFFDGVCPGEIIPEERGSNGFGYDPIFLLAERGLTMAQLSMAEKNKLSHRARAIQAALPYLAELLLAP